MQELKLETVDTMEEILPLLTELLSLGKSVRIYPRGTSMLPMLRQGIDSVVLSPVTDAPKKYDIPLYRRDNGKCVLHRIVEAGETYVCMGDNQFAPEREVRPDQLLGMVTAFYRGEKYRSLRGPGYRLYCRLWCGSRKIRHFLHRGLRWLRRHFA